MKTNREFTCRDVKCIFKFLSYNSGNHYGKPHHCKLNNNIAKQIFEEYGITTCEFGLGQHEMSLKERQQIYRVVNQMIREEKNNGYL